LIIKTTTNIFRIKVTLLVAHLDIRKVACNYPLISLHPDVDTGLRVVDASIIPVHVSGNIVSMVYAIAGKGADLVKEYWGL
jgi:hypothetical protein